MKKNYLLLFLFSLLFNNLFAQNLITNGDFETGGTGVGFNVPGIGYTQLSAPFLGVSVPGNYAFITDAQQMNTTFISGSDHTTGTGNMMVIDGNLNANQPFWNVGNTVGTGICGLNVGTKYTFSYWIKSASATVVDVATQANIDTQFVNASAITLISGNTIAPLPANGWQQVTYTFVATATCVNISLLNTNGSVVGNDFAVDDFSLNVSLGLNYNATNVSCFNANDGSIVITGTGGVTPYISYSISGTSSATNATGIFTNLSPGTYDLSITDSNNETVTVTGIVITQPAALPTAVITGNATVCLNAAAPLITFTGSNATAPYTFTYNINGGANQTITTTSGNSVTLNAPTTALGTFTYNLISVQAGSVSCVNPVTMSAAVKVISSTATINSNASACLNNGSSLLTFTGSNGIAPYTFTYTINGGANQSITTIIGNSISINIDTSTLGPITYHLIGVESTGSLCFNNPNLIKTINIINPPTASISGNTTICPGNTATITVTGTPNTIVSIKSSSGFGYSVTLDASGTGQFQTPILQSTTVYSLQTASSIPSGCTVTLTGSVEVFVNKNGCASVLAGNVDLQSVSPICNLGETKELSAAFQDLGTTTQYAVTSIPYCPQAAFFGPGFTPISVGTDDVWSPDINLPFDFCFFGVKYNKAHVGSNGLISFANPAPGSGSGYVFTQSVPNPAFPWKNAIYGVLQDSNPVASPPEVSVNWQLYGTAPCRKLVVNFYHLGQYNCGQSVGLQTYQMVLYEISNIIEVYVQDRTPCNTWQSGRGLIGIQNAAGTLGYTPPNRNTGNWSAHNEAWRFTPSGPSAVTFQWFEGATPISTNTTITVAPTVTTTYTAQAIYNTCTGLPPVVIRKDVTVEVFPDLTNAPSDMVQCNSTFDLTTNNAVILGSLNPSDYEINYHLTLQDAEYVLNAIPNPTTFDSSGQIIYASIQELSGTCIRVKQFNLIPLTPVVAPIINDVTVCGQYILQPLPAGSSYHTATGGNAGTMIPVGTAITSTQQIFIFAQSNTTPVCTDESSFTVSVNPMPTATISGATSICSGNTAVITFNGTANATVTYTIDGGANQIIVLDALGEATVTTPILTTSTTYDLVSVESAGPSVCSQSQTGSVTINVTSTPTATISGTTTICSGTTTVITFNGTANATVTYTVDGGVGQTIVLDATGVATVTTPALTANSTYTLVSAAYPGPPVCSQLQTGDAIVTVVALPTATISGTTTICSGTSTTITFNGTANATVTYTIDGGTDQTIVLDAAGVATVTTPVLTANSTYALVSVASAGPTVCSQSQSGSAIVTVNALPTATISGTTAICSGTSTTITFNGTANATVTYTIDGGANQTIVLDGAGAGTVTTPVLTANSTYALVSVSSAGALICSQSQSGSAIVTVNPLPTVTISGTTTICSGSSTAITFNGTPNAIVTYNIDGGGDLTTTLDGTGTSTVSTGNITAQTVFNLISVSTNTGAPICSQNQTGSATVSIVSVPVITDPTPLQVCDDNNDGIATFILTTKDNEITGGQPNLVVSYHETPTDAQNGVNPIVGPYPNINAGTQTIYVNVYHIAAPQCASFTTLQLIVNPRPIPNPAISNYELCDANNPGDEVENFNLPTKSLEILNGQTGSVVTYYETQLDAQNETSPIDTTVLYLNTANPQQIWIRLENNTTGCFSVSSFQLVVNPLPTVVAPNPMNACSNGVPDVAEFNLPLNDSTISGGVPNVTVSYYLTLSDAQNEVNPLAIPYTNISNPQTVYVNVKNNTTGCSDTTSLVLNVTQGPTANTPSALEVCDPNSDGFAAFDLESANNEISGGSVPAGVTITYHETQTDAQNGTNALTSPYTNIVVNTQPIYVRVSYALTGCSNFVTLQLIVHSTPEATAIAPLEVCDDNADGFASFNLTTATAGILGGLDPAQHAVSYYVLQADAQSGTSPILSELNYVNTTANAQTIWVRVEHTTTGCFDVISLGLIVNPLPSAPFPVPSYSLCDYNTPGDGIEEFDLSTKIPQIVGLQTGLDVTFHLNASDATAGINEITNPTTYSNIVNAQTLHVRVENVATNCFVVTTMDIRVEPLPSPVQPPAPIAECDANGDGFAFFDLNALIPGILNGASPITTEITFHETVIDAQNGNNDLLSPYENINPFVHFIQVRAENTLTGCYSIIQIELNVNSSPIIPASTVLQDLTECDADNNNQNGFTAFDLTVQTPILEAAQSGPAGDYEIRYYTTQANAQAGINPIIGEDSFINTANPQTIWVVVNNTVTGCSNIGTFQLIVGIPLALTTPAPLSLCDDGPTTPVPTRVFDLTVKNNEITQNLPGYTVAYYLTYADALADTNVIPNPTAYTNVTNAQTLWAAVTSAAGCRSYTTLTIRVMPLPTPETDPAELVKCDDNNSPNGTELFDLTTNESYIANGDLGLTFAYYPTQADAEAQTNEIALPTLDPTAYEAATGTIWIRVMNNQVSFSGNNCYVLVQQSMLVNPLPIVVTNPTYKICDTTVPATYIATFTLSEMDDDLLLGTTQNVNDFTITYHLTLGDAQTGANPLPNSYNNVPDPITHEQTIYPRIVNNTTGCVNFTSEVTLVVAAGATATAPAAFATCDYDFATGNGIYTIDLTQFDAEALAGQDPLLFTVAYFATEAEAIAGTNPITTPAAYPASTGMVWIVVTNETTLCRSNETFVSITVEPLAEPVIASTSGSDTICVEWGTNVLLSGLTLDSGITDPNYTFQWSLNGQPILINGTNSTYVIDTVAPGDYTVVATSTSVLGCVSNISAPFPVIQSGPAVAIGSGYTVSDAFSENQVITVTVQGHGVYHYQLDNGPIVDNGGVFTNVGLGSHDIQVYDVKGITACSPFQINDIQTINYPNYFTPNGDGIHDTWNIIGLSSQSNAKIYIFDRYGKLIKQISPSSPTGWDGTYNGQLLPSSDYWFTVDYVEGGANKVFKAHFSMKR